MCLGPWANSVELGVALCASDPMTGKIGCHPKIDRHLDNAKRDWLMSEAAHRMVARVMAEGMAGLLWGALGYTASDCIREEVRVLEAAGIEP
jgi:hypothetical protein